MDRTLDRKCWRVLRITGISVPLLLLLALTYHILLAGSVSRLHVEADRLTISTVEKGPFQEFIRLRGMVVPIRTVYLDALAGGRVDQVRIEAGSMVKEGDIILELTNMNLLLDIMKREAELFQQSNNLRNTHLSMAQHDLALRGQLLELDFRIKQQKRLVESYEELRDVVAMQDFEASRETFDYLIEKRDLTLKTHEQDALFRKTQIAQIEASLERMRENLEVARENLESLVIRAPVSGHLTSLNAEVGESKARGQRLGQVDILDGFKVRLAIDEHYITRVSVGQGGELTLAEKSHSLVIRKIYPEVIGGRFAADAFFDDIEPEAIRRGQTLRIRLELGDLSEAILLPRGGFHQMTGGRWVFVVDESGELARKREVQLGSQNPLHYEVLSGVDPGERVITSSYDQFGEVKELVLQASSTTPK